MKTFAIWFEKKDEAISKFNRLKINVFVGVKLTTPEEIIEEYLCGTLETNGSFVDK
jgi:hypothetical protein